MDNKAICGTDEEDARALSLILRKVSWVLLPILFLAGLLNTLDRTNLSFAALQMNAELSITPQTFGLASGLFFLGYGVFMLPSTFMTMLYGARWWYGAITVAWGVVATCNAFISSPGHLFALRLLLGVFESGSATSAWHLLAQFYPRDRLTKPYAVMTLCHIAASVIAAPLAAGLLSLHGKGGLAGWKWLFILEGVPSVAMGLAMMVWLPSHPLTATKVLSREEAELLHLKVHGSPEAADAARQPVCWRDLLILVWDAVKRPLLWVLVVIGVLWGLCSVSIMTWLPIIVNNMLSGTVTAGGTSSGTASNAVHATLLSAIPYICGGASTMLLAWHADRVKEHTLHFAAAYIAGGVVLACFGPLYGAAFGAGFLALVVGMMAVFGGQPVMTCRVAAALNVKHVGIGLSVFQALVTTVGGFAGPYVYGAVVSKHAAFTQATLLMGLFLAAAGILATVLGACEQWRLMQKKKGAPPELCQPANG